MAQTFIVSVCWFLCAIAACTACPPKCSYQRCSYWYDGAFSPDQSTITDNSCITQKRRVHIRKWRHEQKGNCPSDEQCNVNDITRKWCKLTMCVVTILRVKNETHSKMRQYLRHIVFCNENKHKFLVFLRNLINCFPPKLS